MHKCVIHFIPLYKQLPSRSEHPGFIVQKVYDAFEKKLWKLTDKDYEENMQREIDLLLQKTRERLGELPSILLEHSSPKKCDYFKPKEHMGRINMRTAGFSVSRVEPTTSFDKLAKAYERRCSGLSKYHMLLSESKVLTGDAHRDKWLEKLLQGFQLVLNPKDNHVSSKFGIAGKSIIPVGSYCSSPDVRSLFLFPISCIYLATFDESK